MFMETFFEQVSQLRASGLSTIPIKTDGSKKPVVSSWTTFEQRLPNDAELSKWFGNGRRPGVAIIGGAISGNLEILDFDAVEIISEWREQVEELAPGLLARLPQVETPKGGLHVYYRCEEIAGNQKLALIEVEVTGDIKGARKRGDKWFKVKTLIETRGEGGYVITAGSPVTCHPLGKPYKLIAGSLKKIPQITPRERDILLTCARSFNRFVKPSQYVAPKQQSKSGRLLPGEDYNNRGKVRALLKKKGWKYVNKSSAGERWQRPGGERPSATLFNDGNFYIFSTNAAPFEYDRAYSPFAIYALLEHGGDFRKAVKELAKEGFGEKKNRETKKANTAAKARVGGYTFNVVETGDQPGVYATDADGDHTFVCSTLYVEADTRDDQGERWGRLLRFPDRDGKEHRWAMPMSLLGGDGRGYREKLLDLGLVIGPSYRTRLLLEQYLHTPTPKRVRCVDRVGWHRGAYVFPDETIGDPDDEKICLQSTTGSNHLLQTAGTLYEWRDQIAQNCVGNSRLVFAVSVAFSATLLNLLGDEGGGFNIIGNTSIGKTTLLNVAGSVWGGGPKYGYLKSWRATDNGLESVAEYHNDGLICLDEIKECDPKVVDEVAYMLANGQGKTRQSRNNTLRRTLEWRLFFLSSGELSLNDHIASLNKRTRGGQEVRLVNIEADAGKGLGIFEDLHGFTDGSTFARYLSEVSKKFYGTPIRSFIKAIISEQELKQEARNFIREFVSEYTADQAVGEFLRVVNRFALIAYGGELATEKGITGWQQGEATKAAHTVLLQWLKSRGTTGSSDEENAIRQVRAFLEKNGNARFQKLGVGDDRVVPNRAGFVVPGDAGEIEEYYILREVFRDEVCQGFNPTMVAKWLEARGLLVKEAGRWQKQVRTPEGNLRAYCVKSKILGS